MAMPAWRMVLAGSNFLVPGMASCIHLVMAVSFPRIGLDSLWLSSSSAASFGEYNIEWFLHASTGSDVVRIQYLKLCSIHAGVAAHCPYASFAGGETHALRRFLLSLAMWVVFSLRSRSIHCITQGVQP